MATLGTNVRIVVVPVVQQHADEAGALWIVREVALDAPHYSLQDLLKLEDRMDAQFDGLRISGEEGWRICEGGLADGEAAEVFTAGVLALDARDDARFRSVLSVIDSIPGGPAGLISAFAWHPLDAVRAVLDWMLGSSEAGTLAVGIGAAGMHRHDPGPVLQEAMRANDDRLRAISYQAAGELGRLDLAGFLWTGYEADDADVRFWAARSGALLGEPNSIDYLMKIASTGDLWSEEALRLAFRRMDGKERLESWKAIAGTPERSRHAVIAAGVIGDPALIPWLIEQMETLPLARIAGESFSSITGVDLSFEDLDRTQPEGLGREPATDHEYPRGSQSRDADLPGPHPDRIAKWWNDHRAEYKVGARYLLGKLISPETLIWVFRNGYQRQRAAAAMEQALAQRGRRLSELRIPGARQLAMLEARRK